MVLDSINSKLSQGITHRVVYMEQDGTKWQVLDKPYGRAALAGVLRD